MAGPRKSIDERTGGISEMTACANNRDDYKMRVGSTKLLAALINTGCQLHGDPQAFIANCREHGVTIPRGLI